MVNRITGNLQQQQNLVTPVALVGNVGHKLMETSSELCQRRTTPSRFILLKTERL